MQVLAERGYQAARVDDIVRVAETSHGTFYLYFDNKQELFATLAHAAADDMAALADDLGPVGPGPDGPSRAAHVPRPLPRDLRAPRRR